MLTFTQFLQEQSLSIEDILLSEEVENIINFLNEEENFNEKKHRWITIKDKNMQNQHIMLNKKDGTIAAGMGGKHSGKTLDDIYKGSKTKSSKEDSESYKKYRQSRIKMVDDALSKVNKTITNLTVDKNAASKLVKNSDSKSKEHHIQTITNCFNSMKKSAQELKDLKQFVTDPSKLDKDTKEKINARFKSTKSLKSYIKDKINEFNKNKSSFDSQMRFIDNNFND